MMNGTTMLYGHGFRRARGRDGFSIVDMAVTLVLLGVLLSIGVATFDNSAYRLDASLSQVIHRSRVARSLAVLRQHDVIVEFDEANPAVVVHEDADNDGARDPGERVMRYPLEEGTRFTRGSAPALGGFAVPAVSFTNGRVTFRRDGSCSEEGAVYVGRDVEKNPRAVVFSRATGYTRIFRFTGSNWVAP